MQEDGEKKKQSCCRVNVKNRMENISFLIFQCVDFTGTFHSSPPPKLQQNQTTSSAPALH